MIIELHLAETRRGGWLVQRVKLPNGQGNPDWAPQATYKSRSRDG